jgi:hypothetical protein
MKRPNEKGKQDVTEATAPSPATETRKSAKTQKPNPPRTTTGGWLTTPKFGFSTSGGGELEPGPERD